MGVTSLRRLAAAASLTTLLSGPAGAHTLAFVDAGRGPVTSWYPMVTAPSVRYLWWCPPRLRRRGKQHSVRYWTRNGQVDKRDFIVVAPTGETDSKGALTGMRRKRAATRMTRRWTRHRLSSPAHRGG